MAERLCSDAEVGFAFRRAEAAHVLALAREPSLTRGGAGNFEIGAHPETAAITNAETHLNEPVVIMRFSSNSRPDIDQTG